jgi:hypothetical protein
MQTTVQDIVSDVITELSQVPGVATQLYSAGIIRQFVQDAFLLEFEDMWWPDYMTYFTVALDGTTGRISSDLIGPLGPISEYGDIAFVWPEGDNRRLQELPPGVNPTTLTGGGLRFISPDYTTANRPLRAWPSESAGNIVIWARQRPKLPLAEADTVNLDRLLLTYGAAWMYCVDDGTVPAQVTKYEMLAVKRRVQVKSRYAQQPLPLDARQSQIPGEWWMVP